MSLFKNIFKKKEAKIAEKAKEAPVTLSLDDTFVHHFIDQDGKFLYCPTPNDVTENILNIVEENQWDLSLIHI